MSIWAYLTGLIRDAAIDKVAEPVQEKISGWVIFGVPIGLALVILFFFGRGYLVWAYFEHPKQVREVAEALEAKGYPDAQVNYAWWGQICLRGRVPYRWRAANGAGTACAGGFAPVILHVKRS